MRPSRKRRANAALIGFGIALAGCAKLLSLDDLQVTQQGASGGTNGADAADETGVGGGGSPGAGGGGDAGSGGAAGSGGVSTGGNGGQAGAGAGAGGMSGNSGAAGAAGSAGSGGASGGSAVGGSSGSGGVSGGGQGGGGASGVAGMDAGTDAPDDALDEDSGMTITSARPPTRPAGAPTPTGGLPQRAFIVRALFLGSVDPATGQQDAVAWQKLGYDIDGKCTSLADSQSGTPGTCTRPQGASTDTLVDGDECRDNNFGSELIHFVSQLDPKTETKLNQSIEIGGSTLLLVIDDLDDTPDDAFAPARLYLAAPVDLEGGAFKWDGTDVREIDAHSLAGNGSDLMNPKQSFLTGYMSHDTWVTGDFNKTPAVFTITLSGQAVPIDALSFTLTIQLSPDHKSVLGATIAAAIDTQKLVASLTPAAYALAGCSKVAADIYLNAIPQWSDLASGAPDFLDTTKPCDTISLGAGATVVPIVVPTTIVSPPDPPPACPDGGLEIGTRRQHALAHTVVDDPVPPTVREQAPAAPYPPQYGAPQGYGAPPRKKGPPLGLLIGGGSTLGVVLIALIVYFAVFHYSPVALHHVPPGTTAVVRLDFVDVVLFAPVRRHLLPIVDEAPQAGATGAASKPRSERIADAVGFSPSRDLREAVVCFLGSEDKVVVIIGGNIPKGKLVPGLLKVAQEEGNTDWIDAGGVMKAKFGGVAVGQAEDGSAIVSTDENLVRAAIPESQQAQRLGVPATGAVTFAFTGDVWKKLSTGPFASVLESLASLKQLDSGNGHLDLSNNPKMETQLLVAGGVNTEDAKATLYRVFTDLRRISELRRKLTGAAQDLAGEEQAFAQSVVETKGPTMLKVTTTWPYDGLDRGAANLAQKIHTIKQNLGKPPQAPGNIQIPGLPGFNLPIPGLTP